MGEQDLSVRDYAATSLCHIATTTGRREMIHIQQRELQVVHPRAHLGRLKSAMPMPHHLTTTSRVTSTPSQEVPSRPRGQVESSRRLWRAALSKQPSRFIQTLKTTFLVSTTTCRAR